MGSQKFKNVEVPLLWGKRAIIQSKEGKISIISLEGRDAIVEILENEPAPDIDYEKTSNGFKLIIQGRELYSFDPNNKAVVGIDLNLPKCQIQDSCIKVGSSVFSGNSFTGFGVGILVDNNGISMGGPLPEGLAKLSL